MKKGFIITIAVSSIMLAACSSEDEVYKEENNDTPIAEATAITLSRSEQAAAEASNAFQYAFFNASNLSDNVDDNVVVSPLSARITLSMVANGLQNQTREEVVSALGCDDIEALNSLASTLLAKLPAVDNASAQMMLAQGVWHTNKYALSESFGNVLANMYAASIAPVDMTDKAGVSRLVNEWCTLNTNGLITNIIDDNAVPDMILLLNSMYFKAGWASKFDVAQTQRHAFYGSLNNTVVNMMSKTFTLEDGVTYWKETEKFSAAQIYFGGATQQTGFSLTVVLPNENEDIALLSRTISADDIAGMKKEMVKLTMPRFSVTMSPFNLKNTLRAMGINRMFDTYPCNVFTEESELEWDVCQGASFAVDENGAVIAAVTLAEGYTTAPGPGKVLNLNRPFLFFVNEHSTGACLMAGKIMNL